jgi:hypothetical protein
MRVSALLLFSLLLSASVAAHASVLSTFTAHNASDNGTGDYAQGFTVSGAGNYNNIVFSFLSPTDTTYAYGTGYLLANPYTGTAAGLSSVPSLGTAAASGGAFTFNPSVTLTSGATYYLYELGHPAAGAIGDEFYFDPSLFYFDNDFGPFTNYTTQLDYVVSGTQATPVSATPEPSGLALLGTGMLTVVGLVRRKLASNAV